MNIEKNRKTHRRYMPVGALLLVLGLSNGVVLAAATQVPTVTTTAATNILQTTATLNGSINANGDSTTVTFDYGLTTAYGSTATAAQSPVTGSTATAVSVDLTGLTPNTLYHFRVNGTNPVGPSNGADLTFTTLPNPPLVTATNATNITTSTLTFNGTANSNGVSAQIAFEVGSAPDSLSYYGLAFQSPLNGSGNVSAPGMSFQAATTYYYRVRGTNTGGTSYSNVVSFTTLPLPAVTTAAATNVTSSTATLNGTVTPNSGESTTVTFQYGLTTSYGTNKTAAQSPVPANNGVTAVSADLTGLTPNTLYHFRTRAITASSNSVVGPDMIFTTAPIPPTVATSPASSITNTSASLNGTVNANSFSSTVTFDYGTSTAYGSTKTAAQSPVTGSTTTPVTGVVTGLTPNTLYHYRVNGTNVAGTSNGNDLTFTTFPNAPTVTSSAATSVTSNAATLNGSVNANGVSTSVTFEYGPTTSYGSTITAAQSPVTGSIGTPVSAALTGLNPSTTYHFRVKGTNTGGTSNGSDLTFTTPQGAPLVTTSAATSVTKTGATLNGSVTAGGLSSTVAFEYGLTTAYGTTMTATPSPVTGITPVAVSAGLSGLAPNTVYHFRVTSTNASGTTNGSDLTFLTLPNAPVVTTTPASNLTANAATLNGSVIANGVSSTVTFEYGLTTAYGSSISAVQSPVTGSSASAVSADISGLTPNTIYHFRVNSTNTGGTTNGSDVTFTTLTAPPGVTTSAASTIAQTTATLNGTVNANGLDSTVTFEYGLTAAYGSSATAAQSPVSGVAPSTVSAAISGLAPLTLYHFRVTSTNAAGSSTGADLTFTTLPNPPIVTTTAATNITINSASLTGTVNSNGVTATVNFESGSTTAYGFVTTAAQSPLNGSGNVSYFLTGLTSSSVIHFRVRATNSGGTSYGQDVMFTTLSAAPVATTGDATSISKTSATLNATVNPMTFSTTVTFDYGLTASYGTTVTATQSPILGSTPKAVSAPISGLTPNTLYHCRVHASNSRGTADGADVTFMTIASGPTVSTLAATSVTSSSAVLNGSVNANGFSTTVTFDYGTTNAYGSTLAAAPSPVTGSNETPVLVVLTGLLPNTQYHFRLKGSSSDGANNGADMAFTTLPGAPLATTTAATGITNTGATLNGSVNANGASSTVSFEYGLTNAYGSTKTALQSPVTGNAATSVSANLTDLLPNMQYHFRVISSNSGGAGSGQDLTFRTLSNIPSATTTAATNITTGGATLNGLVNAQGASTAVTFEYGPTAEYGTTIPALQSPVSDSTAVMVSATVSGLSIGTIYHFRVVAVSTGGTSRGEDQTFVSVALPTISGSLANQAVTDKTSLKPFSNVVLGDTNTPPQVLSVSVAFDPAKGSLSQLGGFTGPNDSVYVFSGTAVQATLAIQGLLFTPAPNRISPGTSETTVFSIEVHNSLDAGASDSITSVVTTSINDAPAIFGTLAGQAVNDDNTLPVFNGVTIADADNPPQLLSVSISLDNAAKGSFTSGSLAASGFADMGLGTYAITGTASATTTAIRQLVFAPAKARKPVGQTETTTLTVSVSDGLAATVVDNTTTIVSTSVINHPPQVSVSFDNFAPKSDAILKATAAASDADNDPVKLTFVWKVNGVPRRILALTTALTDAFDLSIPGNGDAGDMVSVEVTPNDGTVDGQAAGASVTVAAPALSSAPLISTGLALANLEMSFSAVPEPPDAIVTWDFGDGTPPQTGMNAKHIYAGAGEYMVTVTIEDPVTHAFSTTTHSVKIGNGNQLPGTNGSRVAHGRAKFDSKGNTIAFGAIIHLSKGIDLTATPMIVSVGGLSEKFQFGASGGKAVSPNGKANLSAGVAHGLTLNQEAKLQVQFKGADLKTQMSHGVAVDTDGMPKMMLLTIQFNGQTLSYVGSIVFKKSGATMSGSFGYRY